MGCLGHDRPCTYFQYSAGSHHPSRRHDRSSSVSNGRRTGLLGLSQNGLLSRSACGKRERSGLRMIRMKVRRSSSRASDLGILLTLITTDSGYDHASDSRYRRHQGSAELAAAQEAWHDAISGDLLQERTPRTTDVPLLPNGREH
jgi:hypothetical protein